MANETEQRLKNLREADSKRYENFLKFLAEQEGKAKDTRSEDIDFISRLNGFGSLQSAQTNNLKGINVHLNGTPAPRNQDSYGITFFTRPDLNLSYDNLAATRMLTPLLTSDEFSMARALRCMLDPRSQRVDGDKLESKVFDSRQAFIPVLTNNLLSISGWPDIAVDTFTSTEGNYKESYSMIDGTSHIFNTFDVTATFRNIQGDPITLLFAIWVHYGSMVYDGTMVPYPSNVLENRIDYMTRIYRLVLDDTFQYVQKIAACGAGFPMASPLGASFNFAADAEFNPDNDQISIPFRCVGVNYLDPILIKEFNATVTKHNPSMLDGVRSSSMIKIGANETYGKYGKIGSTLINVLSHQMYPRIDATTYELEWYAFMGDYSKAIIDLKDKGII